MKKQSARQLRKTVRVCPKHVKHGRMRLVKKPVILLSNVFRNIGARYKRIRKRPRGKPSPQLYAYKKEKLQELEELDSKGELVLYYADESHVCTNGYVPYGWQFKNEDIYIPSEKAARLNIFGMITKRNQYKGFTTKRVHQRRQDCGLS